MIINMVNINWYNIKELLLEFRNIFSNDVIVLVGVVNLMLY